MKLSIVSPCGGYKNHFRWLLLCHEKHLAKFVETCSYDRTCFNWLQNEWKFRTRFDNFICIRHSLEEAYDMSQKNKVISLIMEPENALRAYIKFNPTLNGHTIESFKTEVETYNHINTSHPMKADEKMLVLKSEDLYKPILDKNLYESAVNFFDFPNEYETANHLHGIWYNLHKQAEKDTLKIKDGWYYTDNIEKPKEKDYNNIVKLMYKIYEDQN